MKKYILLFCIALGFQSCGDEEDKFFNPNKAGNEIANVESNTQPEITVNTTLFDVKKGYRVQNKITSGSSEYNIIVLDPNIANATIEGNIITVEGIEQGETEVILTDKGGDYKNIKVNVYLSDVLTTDAGNSLTIRLPFGVATKTKINILTGNGEYSATSSDETVATTEIQENEIVITGQKDGTSQVIIKDSRGLESKIEVNVETTNEPYTPEQLVEIKSNPKIRYIAEGSNILDITTYNVTYYAGGIVSGAKPENACYGMFEFGFRAQLWVQFPQRIDYTLGKKEGGLITYGRIRFNKILNEVDVNFAVIKHEEGVVWATYYAIHEGKAYVGYMVFNE